jgi:hypothetical protein
MNNIRVKKSEVKKEKVEWDVNWVKENNKR